MKPAPYTGLLFDLALQYGANKVRSDVAHYCALYEKHVGASREAFRSVLEIGVQAGGSLRMWKAYFPNAGIVGMDNDARCWNHRDEGAGIYVIIGDQSVRRDCERAAAIGTPYDLIIDDGGHRMKQQQESFDHLWSHVKAGGWYVIEDLQTSQREKYQDPGLPRTSTVLAEIADELCGGDRRRRIVEFHLYPWIVFMRKGA